MNSPTIQSSNPTDDDALREARSVLANVPRGGHWGIELHVKERLFGSQGFPYAVWEYLNKALPRDFGEVSTMRRNYSREDRVAIYILTRRPTATLNACLDLLMQQGVPEWVTTPHGSAVKPWQVPESVLQEELRVICLPAKYDAPATEPQFAPSLKPRGRHFPFFWLWPVENRLRDEAIGLVPVDPTDGEISAAKQAEQTEYEERERAKKEGELQNGKRIREERLARGACELCGRKLSFLQRLFSSGRSHKECASFSWRDL